MLKQDPALASRRRLMTPSTGRFPFHSRLGNAEKGKRNKVRSNCRKRLCGPDLVALESHLLRRPPAPFFKTAVVSGHQAVCCSSRGWVASRGVTRACKSLLPELNSTGVRSRLLPGALPARLPGACVEASSSQPGPQVAECEVQGIRLLRAWLSSMGAGRRSH